MSLLTMATIEEDYVSFETAKLLKEKGFEGYSIISIFDEDAANAYIKELQEKHLPYSSDDPKLKEFFYTKPTLQMAMKWLRKAHNINIDIVPIWNQKRFEYQVFIITPENAKHCYVDEKLYLVYEQACEAAIKYSLKNLI
jgi:hypothetical protein